MPASADASRRLLLAGILVGLPPVLVGQPAPRLDITGQYLAAMEPVIAEVEDELEASPGVSADPTVVAA